MEELVNITHPFQTVEEFQLRAGDRQAGLIHRLAGKYPQLLKRCGVKRALIAVSVAWALTDMAKAGNMEVFDHIDAALSPISEMGCVKAPPNGCVMVQGQPFFIGEGEQCMLRFLWDGFTIFIDHEDIAVVQQVFFDIADLRQSKAYTVMGEMIAPSPMPEKKMVDAPMCTVRNTDEPNLSITPSVEETVSKAVKETVSKVAKETMSKVAKETMEEDVEAFLLADLVDEVLELGDLDVASHVKMAMEPLCRKERGKARDMAIEQTDRLEYCMRKMKNKQNN